MKGARRDVWAKAVSACAENGAAIPGDAYAMGGRSVGTMATLTSVATNVRGDSPCSSAGALRIVATAAVATCACPQCSICAVCVGGECVSRDGTCSPERSVAATTCARLSTTLSESTELRAPDGETAPASMLLRPASPSCTSGMTVSSELAEKASATSAVRHRRSNCGLRKARSIWSGSACAAITDLRDHGQSLARMLQATRLRAWRALTECSQPAAFMQRRVMQC